MATTSPLPQPATRDWLADESANRFRRRLNEARNETGHPGAICRKAFEKIADAVVKLLNYRRNNRRAGAVSIYGRKLR